MMQGFAFASLPDQLVYADDTAAPGHPVTELAVVFVVGHLFRSTAPACNDAGGAL